MDRKENNEARRRETPRLAPCDESIERSFKQRVVIEKKKKIRLSNDTLAFRDANPCFLRILDRAKKTMDRVVTGSVEL